MPVTLKTLLKVAPFPEEQRQKILASYDNLTEDQQMRLSSIGWLALSKMYQSRVQYRTDLLKLEIQQGKKKYDQAEFDKIDQEETEAIVAKLRTESEQVSIEEVRQQLKNLSLKS